MTDEVYKPGDLKAPTFKDKLNKKKLSKHEMDEMFGCMDDEAEF